MVHAAARSCKSEYHAIGRLLGGLLIQVNYGCPVGGLPEQAEDSRRRYVESYVLAVGNGDSNAFTIGQWGMGIQQPAARGLLAPHLGHAVLLCANRLREYHLPATVGKEMPSE